MTKETFDRVLKQVMKHNKYEKEEITVDVCSAKEVWTPCDLILREYLNNGGGSAKGFLGIGTVQCRNAFDYICDNKQAFINANMISRDGWNNCGYPLWNNYGFYK